MRKPISAGAQLVWLAVAHGAVDAYALIVPFLAPILLAQLAPPDRREFYAGAFAAVSAASTSLGQVGFGHLADRARSPSFLWGGLVVAAIGMSLLGLAPNLGVAFLMMLVGGLGVAAFHPQAAVGAARLAENAHGFGVSLFITGGNIGQAVGPFLLIYALSAWGPRAFVPAMIPGLALALVLTKMLRGVVRDNGSAAKRGLVKSPIPYRPVIVLFCLVVVRTVTLIGLVNFLSLYLTDLGLNDVSRAAVLGGFLFFGSMGILLGGSLSDHLPRMPLLVASLLAAAPLFVGALQANGILFVALLLGGNFLFQLSTPIYIVMGQETMPERANVATSLVMGAAWGTAGLLNLPVGALANSIGLEPTLLGLSVLPVPAALLLFLLPRRRSGVAAIRAGEAD